MQRTLNTVPVYAIIKIIFKGRVINLPSDPIGPQLLLQLCLILVNAFFAAAEIAFISLNDTKMKALSAEGDKKAAKMLRVLANPSKFLSTIQIGITLSGFLASAFAADNFAGRIKYYLVTVKGVTVFSPETIHTLALIFITIILSYFTLVLGELLPKRIAMQKPETVARAFCALIGFLTVVLGPAASLLSASTNALLRLVRIDPNKTDPEVSEEEIMYMVDAADEKGAIGKNEKEMIENIFEFNNTTAEEVMIHRTDVSFIQKDQTDAEILHIIQETGFSRFPVFSEDQDDIIGILIARDFLINLQIKEKKSLTDLIRPAYFVPESVRTDILFKNMQSDNIHIAIIIDEYGGTCGLVTMEDLLEEIVGNIYDESDDFEDAQITQLGDGSWRVSGSTLIETLREDLDLELPESDEFDTLGGLIINELTSIPTDGSTPVIEAFGYEFSVEEVKERRVELVKISVLQPGNEDSEQQKSE